MFALLGKKGASLLFLLVSVLFAYPGVLNLKDGYAQDSFPVSSFAMFANKRALVHSMAYVRGIRTGGKEPILLHAGAISPGGMNQNLARLGRLRSRSRKEIQAACEAIGERIKNDRRYRDVVRLQLTHGLFRPELYFGQGEKKALRESVFGRCRVPDGKYAHRRSALEPPPPTRTRSTPPRPAKKPGRPSQENE